LSSKREEVQGGSKRFIEPAQREIVFDVFVRRRTGLAIQAILNLAAAPEVMTVSSTTIIARRSMAKAP
jgi:hypothetical protein